MIPAFYVVRLPARSTSGRLTVESVPFKEQRRADNWCEFIGSQHARDDVFVIQLMDPIPHDDQQEPAIPDEDQPPVGTIKPRAFCVVRLPVRSTIDRLRIESIAFDEQRHAESRRASVQSRHPKDGVFVIRRMEPIEEDDQ